VALLDVVLGVSTEGTKPEEEGEGEEARQDGGEETEWTHGWVFEGGRRLRME